MASSSGGTRQFNADNVTQSVLALPSLEPLLTGDVNWHQCSVCFEEFQPTGEQQPVQLITAPLSEEIPDTTSLGDFLRRANGGMGCSHCLCLKCAARVWSGPRRNCPCCQIRLLGYSPNQTAIHFLNLSRWLLKRREDSDQTKTQLEQQIEGLQQRMRETETAQASLHDNFVARSELEQVRREQEAQLRQLRSQHDQMAAQEEQLRTALARNAETEAALEGHTRSLQERDRTLEERNRALAQRDRTLEQHAQSLQSLQTEMARVRSQPVAPQIDPGEVERLRAENAEILSSAQYLVTDLEYQIRMLKAASRRALDEKNDEIAELQAAVTILRGKAPQQQQTSILSKVASFIPSPWSVTSSSSMTMIGVIVQRPEDYRICERLGDSLDSTVWRAQSTNPNILPNSTSFAIKCVRIVDDSVLRGVVSAPISVSSSSSSSSSSTTALTTPTSPTSPTHLHVGSAASSSAAAAGSSQSTAMPIQAPGAHLQLSKRAGCSQLRTFLSVAREAMFLRTITHPNITPLIGFIPLPHSAEALLVSEYLPMDLAYVIESSRTPSSEIWLIAVASQLLAAVHFLHNSNVVHRNISTSSIVYNPETGAIKLASFRQARSLSSTGTLDAVQPALSGRRFLPPEILLGESAYIPDDPNLWKACDMWSVGVVLADLTVGGPLFHSSLVVESMLTVEEIRASFPKQIVDRHAQVPLAGTLPVIASRRHNDPHLDYNNVWYQMIALLLDYSPRNRYTAERVVQEFHFLRALPSDVPSVRLKVADEQLFEFAYTALGLQRI